MQVFRQLLLIAMSICMVSSEDFDPADQVVKIKFKYTKNKQITEFTQEEKDDLVKIHNAYRSLVRPYRSDMIEVTWDDDIAAFAQDWANQCTATHRGNRDLDPWINMGENLFWWYGGGYNVGLAVKYWWDEVQYYTLSNQKCTRGEVCGHYITMVWAKTEKIGCGVARCDRLWDQPDYGRGAYYFVCNYSGRFVSNMKPYKATDIPCSACYKTGYPKCRHNLCVSEDAFASGEGYDGSTDMVGLHRSLNYTSEPDTPTITTTTVSPVSTTPAWSMFEEIDEYCRSRGNSYVRRVCWRLNNMLRDQMGAPSADPTVDKRDEGDSTLEGGKVLSVRDVGSTTEQADQLSAALGEIDDYCEGLDSSYKRRVCRRIDNNFRDIVGLDDQ